LTTTCPSSKLVTMSYGTNNAGDDRLSRLATVTAQGEAQSLGQFAWMLTSVGRLKHLRSGIGKLECTILRFGNAMNISNFQKGTVSNKTNSIRKWLFTGLVITMVVAFVVPSRALVITALVLCCANLNLLLFNDPRFGRKFAVGLIGLVGFIWNPFNVPDHFAYLLLMLLLLPTYTHGMWVGTKNEND
jgi:hypothetical protein